MNAECPSQAQRLSSDMISTLPQTIIENILCLLQVEEAARTSILSREWRYKWTTIPKLEFGWFTEPISTIENKQYVALARAGEYMNRRSKLPSAIHQVLLMRQGPIHEFFLDIIGPYNCFELDQIIFHLSRNHVVKKLKLGFDEKNLYKLPLCAFSLHQLTDLHLGYVDLSHQPISGGFGSLRSLRLVNVRICTNALLHLLSKCPSLKSFWLLTEGDIGSKDCAIIELFKCMPVIEDLTTCGDCVNPWLFLDSVTAELPTSLIHLKYFCFNQMCFADDHGLTFLAFLIKCSPNLEKIELRIERWHNSCYENDICSGILEEYSDVWLEHLKELKIRCFSNLKRQMEFVKFILVRSPKLKKVKIHSLVEKDKESDMLKVLLQAPRASPVKIVVK